MKQQTKKALDVHQFSDFFNNINSIISHCINDVSHLFSYMQQPINSEEEVLERAKVMDELMDLAKSDDDIVVLIAHAISDRIEEYEQKNLDFPEQNASDLLAYMMKIKNIKQKDLSHIATQSIISEILNKKRSMTVEYIKKFSNYFNIPASLFLKG